MTRPHRLACALVALLLVAYAALVVVPVYAQSGTAALTCTPPTTLTTGAPITGAITYKFYRGSSATSQTTASPVQTSCAYTFTGLAPGTHYFSSTAIVGGVESARSNVASKNVLPDTPNPPTGLTVQADQTAYIINQSDNRIALVPAGTVAIGTPCDTSSSYGGKYIVPIAAVTWAGTVRSRVALATCS